MRATTLFQIVGVLAASQSTCGFLMPQPTTRPTRVTTTSSLSLVGLEAAADLVAGGQLLLAEYPVSPEPIHSAFQVGTFFSQPFFLLMILFPKSTITKKVMGGLGKYRTRPASLDIIHVSHA